MPFAFSVMPKAFGMEGPVKHGGCVAARLHCARSQRGDERFADAALPADNADDLAHRAVLVERDMHILLPGGAVRPAALAISAAIGWFCSFTHGFNIS